MDHHTAGSEIAPEEIRSIRERLNLTQAEAGELIGGGPRAFTKYEAGTVKPAASVINLLRVLDAHPNALAALERSPRRRAVAHGPLPFEISAEDIERLTESDMHELLRRLLRAEALANELPLDGIHVSSATSSPDGGEDGRIEWTVDPARTPFLPGRLCQFQAKAGKITPTEAANEALKPMVRQVLESGGHYIVLCGKRYVRQLIERREAAIRDAVRHAGIDVGDHQIDFRDADRTADWVNHHAPVAMWVKERTQPGSIGPFRSWSHWAGRAEHDGSPWLEDDRLAELTTWLLERATQRQSVARVIGLWGIGKSRLVLEGIGGSLLSPMVMYTVEAEVGPYAINEAIENMAAAGTRAIAVVDECTIETHRVLADKVRRSSSRLSLITIDDEVPSGAPDETTYVVTEAPFSVTQAVVERVAPGLHSEDQRRLVLFSQGFPKIATRISRLWGGTPIANATDDDLVDAFVLGRTPTEHDVRRKSAELLATFGPIRIEPKADSQLPLIASMARHLTPDDLDAGVIALVDRGAAQRRGGYVVLHPRPIAMRLAERQWKEWTQEKWEQALTGSIRTGLRVSAARNLALLNDTEIARQVVMHVCRSGGPLDVTGMTNPGSPEVLSFLAEIHGRTVAQYIERNLNRIDRLSMIPFPARHTLVRTLEKIAFASSTFVHGGRLLLRLASLEDDVASDAAHSFQALFPVLLGTTEADGTARLSLVDALLAADDPVQRSLVARALIAGSKISRFGRGVGAETHGSRPALREWRPATREQFHGYVQGCVARLGTLATNDDGTGSAARAALAHNLRSLIAAGYVDTLEPLIRRVSKFTGSWNAGLASLRMTLEYDSIILSDDVVFRIRKLVEELQPRTLESRVHSYVTGGAWDSSLNRQSRVETVKSLGAEAFQHPNVLTTLLPGLSRGRQSMACEFGESIGERDEHLGLFEPIIQAAVQTSEGNRNYDLLAGFITGISSARPDVVEPFKQRAAQTPALAPILPQICRHAGITPADIRLLIDALQTSSVPPWRLKEWYEVRDVAASTVAPLFEAMMNHSADAFAIAVDLMEIYTHGSPQRLEELQLQICKLAKTASRWPLHYDALAVYSFKRIMSSVLEKGRGDSSACTTALELTKALVDGDPYHDFYLMESVLPILLSGFPEISWPLIGEAIISNPRLSWRLEEILRDSFDDRSDAAILSLPQDTLLAWCHAHPERAPVSAASMVPVFVDGTADVAKRLHPVMTRLLEHFGERDDVLQASTRNIDMFEWVDSWASYYAQFEEPLKGLQNHNAPQVRNWAEKMSKVVSERKEKATKIDEERAVQAELR